MRGDRVHPGRPFSFVARLNGPPTRYPLPTSVSLRPAHAMLIERVNTRHRRIEYSFPGN